MTFTQSQSISIWARLPLKAQYVLAFAILFLFASSASGTPVMTVQHNSGGTSSGTSVAVAFNSSVTTGNVILVAESSASGVSLVAPADSQINSFTQLVTLAGTSGNSSVAIYAATASASGADTVTCNISAANNIHCHIYEVQGITTVVDQTGTLQQTSDSLSVPTTAATTNADDYLLAFFADNGTADLITAGTGWEDSELSDNADGDTGFTEDMIVTAEGVQTATATSFSVGLSGTADTYVNVIVALKASGTATVATPTLSPSTGTYGSAVNVTLADTTLGSTIYYTTSGSAPTTGSSIYSSPILVSAAETLEALATASGYAQSSVASAAYAMGVAGTGVPILTVQHNSGSNESASSIAVPFSNGVTAGHILLVAESTFDGETLETPTDSLGNSFNQLVIAGINNNDVAVVAIYAATANSSGADTVTCNISAVNNIHCNIYEVQGVTAIVDRAGNDQLNIYNQAVSTSSATANTVDYLFGFFADNYQASTYTAGPGFGDIELSNGDGGDSAFSEDEVVISTGIQTATATNAGGGNTYSIDGYYNAIVALEATGTPTVPLPTFSPVAGSYLTAQSVTLSDATVGATIYYTTDGTTPTTGSSVYSGPISVPAGETVMALATASGTGFAPSSVATAVYLINPAATPTFSPSAGTYATAQTVTISDATGGATIYYTTDGSAPATGSSVYSNPITVSATETVMAIATAAGQSNSAVGSVVYTIGTLAATPLFSPSGGAYTSAQSVTISDSTGGATIYYTTNGTTPTTGSSVYTSAITVAASVKLEAIATANTYLQSNVASAFYTISSSSTPIMTVQHTSGSNEDASSLAVPFNSHVTSGNVLIVAESSYAGVTLEAPTDLLGNTYTLLVTGNYATHSVGAVYAATATSSGADTVTCNTNNSSNNIHCNIYEVQGITATVDQIGTFSETGTSLNVSTSAATTNAADYIFAFYADNDNGSYLTAGPGMGDAELSNDGGDTGFSEDKVVVTTGIQTATATSNQNDGFENLIVALTTTGTPTAATPTLSPGTGSYTSIQYVTISSWTAGTTIYYTTDGTLPTTGSTLYTGQVSVSSTETLKAIATAAGFANSPMNSAVYTINLPSATPTFSPAGGSYPTAQSVTISDSTPSATVYYTTDGTTPTTGSTAYSSPVTVAVWETLQAVAIAPGKSVSNVGVASYTIGNGEAAAPTFSPGTGTYAATQTVTITDETAGATIYYTTDGTTPMTSSPVYSAVISVSASETLQAFAIAGGYSSSGVGSAFYTINNTAGACDGMSLGRSVDGAANMNGFVPFQNATGTPAALWSTNIANAAVDPNNAAIQTTAGFSGEAARVLFGSTDGDGGIPFSIVDSSQTPLVSINVIDYASNSDVVLAPYPNNVAIEGAAADCSGWPDAYQSDSHTNVLDRNTCWLYETYQTNRCNGLYDAAEEAIWDMQNGEFRPWGWTSTDAAGLSVLAGLVKYDEAASGNIQHAIRFTMQQSKNDANDGYFVEPASHAAGTTYGAPTVEGMRLRLKASYNTNGYSSINKAILVAMQQYGLIMADNGGYGYFIGATDSRWNDADLANIGHISFTNFDVIDGTPSSTTMTPAYPGWDSVTAPTGPPPVINSFTASPQTVSAGTPVTFSYSVSGDSYDYIDMAGPVRLTQNGGGPGVNTESVTIYPTTTQTYMLYSVNQYGNNGVGVNNDNGTGQGYGVTVSTPITIVVPGSAVTPPTFTPPAGPYTTAQTVSFNTTTYPYATFYYTTDGSTPTYPPTGTTQQYPVKYQPMSPLSGNLPDITVSASETVNAIAVVQGYAAPSAVTTGVYEIGPITGTPSFSPAAGSYGLAQTVTISDSTGGANVYYTTDGTTPTTGSSIYGSPLTVSANETLEAFATSASANNSVVATATYTIGGTAATPTFSPVAGNYVGNQSVTISDSSSGATIYYTTNGSTPSTGSTTYSAPITVSTSETLQALAAGSGYTNSPVASAAYTILASTPTFSPVAGSYINAQTVTISEATSGTTVYYTTNGTAPTTSSPVYSSAITVSASETLEALAAGGGNAPSAVGSAAYTIVAATPTFSPVAGNYGVALTVTISDTTPSSTIYYTTNGTAPTTTSSIYTSPISVSSTETLEALATAVGDNNSAVGSVAYTITIGGPAATPSISLGTGSYIGTQTVTISDTSIGATIYYTLTPGTVGTSPTTSSTIYTGPVSVPSTSVLEAFAVGGGFTASSVNSASYNITITVAYVQQCSQYAAGGGSGASANCTLTGVNAGDTLMIGIWTPNATLSSVTSSTTAQPVSVFSNYNADSTYGYMSAYILPNTAAGSITITASETGYYVGDWLTVVEYTNVSATPLDGTSSASSGNSDYSATNVNSGTFNTSAAYDMLWSMCSGEYAVWTAGTSPIAWTQEYYAENSNNGVAIENGVAGTAGSYYGECYKSDEGYDQGILAVALKGIGPVAVTPSFSPAAGTYTSIQTVTISDGTGSSTIYYTTNGNAPTTASSVYSTPITVSATETLEAMATAGGYGNSTVASAVYTINLPQTATPTFSPTAGNYATAQTVTISDTTPSATIYYTTDGTAPTTSSTHYTAPISVSATTETLQAVAIAPDYLLSSVGSALYTIGSPAATPTFSPAAGTYTTIQSVTISDSTGSSTIYYTTNGSTPNTNSSIYSSAITVSTTETINAIATAAGYVQSSLASAAYTINLPTAVTPIFSPAAGTYGTAQSVVIGTTTPSSTIYYTTNGTAPTTSSSVYSTAVAVASTETLEAIAVVTGYNNSAVASAAYSISAGGGSAPVYVQQCNQYTAGSGQSQSAACTLIGVTAGDTLVIGVWDSDSTETVTSSTTAQPVNEIQDYTSSQEYYSNAYLSTYILSNAAAGSITITATNTGYYDPIFVSVVEFANVAVSPYDGQGTGTLHNYAADVYGTTSTFNTSAANDILWTMCDYSAGTTLAVGDAPVSWNLVTNVAEANANILTEYGAAGAAGSYYGDCEKIPSGYGPDIEAIALMGASTPTVATPTFSPGTETYTSVQTVTISDSTESSTIYYTTNGSAPTTTSSVYSTPITVSTSQTLEAFATAASENNSSVAEAVYVINLPPAATPTFSPAAGTYTTIQTVTISDSTPSSTIYYTTNGTTPSTASSLFSSSPINVPVSATETLQAIAVETGYTNSAVASGVYSIFLQAATPTFSPVAGSYSTVQTVTISDTTPSSTIYYTTNGTTPLTSSSIYGGPITVPAPETIEAIAIASGYSLSSVGSAVYTYPIPSSSISYVQQCSNYGGYVESISCTLTGVGAGHALIIGVYTSGTLPYTTTITSSVGTPATVVSNLADYSGVMDTAILSNTASGSITITAATSAYMNIWISVSEYSNAANPALDTSATKSLSGSYGSSSISSPNFTTTSNADMLWSMCYGIPSYVSWSVGTLPITWTSVGSYSAQGVFVENGSAGAAGSYYGNCTTTTTNGGALQASIMAVAIKASTPTAATPTFSPVAGSYSEPQTVTISTTTPSSTIYYTTNGAIPTTASTSYIAPITVATYETVNAIAVSTGYANSVVGSAAYGIGVATPTFSPVAGSYTSIQTVTISDATGGATIYYTTNGNTPTTTSPVYSTPIIVSVSQTLEALGVLAGNANSAVASAVYTINLTTASPTFSPVTGTYNSTQIVTISDATGGAAIYYTTNGTTPTTNSPTYSAPISVSVTQTVEALAAYAGDANSTVTTAVYTLQVLTPTFSPVAGSYSTDQSVTISDSTGGAAIYYTTNGSTPTTGSAIYSGPVAVTSPQTLEAIGVLAGYSNSATASAAYTFPPPSSSPALVQQCSNEASGPSSVSCTLNGVKAGDALVIGSEGPVTLTSVTASVGTPTFVVSDSQGEVAYILANAAAGTITITANQSGGTRWWLTVSEYSGVPASPLDTSAQGYVAGYSGSSIATNSFNTAAASDLLWSMCTIDGGGTLAAGVAPITWTLLATAPGGSPDYLPPIIAEYGGAGAAGTYTGQCAVGADGSQIVTVALLSSGPPAAATPTFSPAAGSYDLPQTVTISTTTPSSTIYYTTNGTTPTTSSAAYSTPITVASYETVEAIAVSSGYSNSAVGSAAYSIGVATPTFSPVAGSYTGTQSVTISDSTGGASIYYTTNGTTPTTNSAIYSGAISVATSQTLEAIGTEAGYTTSAVGSAAYAITAATPTFSPAAGTYSTIQTVTISTTTPSATIYYTTNGTTPTTSSSVYSSALTVSASETLSAIVTATGDITSAVGSAAYTINLPTAATPSFSPGSGSYGTAQSVTISDTTPSSTIYYTTNGTAPTTGSSVYSSAISVSSNETLEAIAVAYNYLNSATNSATYTIAAATPAFSPGSGTYGSAQSVTISDTTPSATIYYTTNGTTPSTGSSVYSAAITVTGAETLEAIATASGYGASAVASAAYTTSPIQPTFSPGPGTYAGTQTVTISDATGGATIYYTTNGTTPTTSSTTYSAPVSVTATEIVEAIAAISGAPASAVTSGIYTIETPAVLTTPAPGSTLTGTSVTFAWSPGNTAKNFELWVGTTAGSSNLYNSGSVTATSETVSDLPSNGQPVYVRLYWYINGSWSYASYTYTATGAPTQAAITTPAAGSTLTGTSVAFAWTPGNTATNFELWAGTTAGSSNLYNSGSVTVTTETVTDLPGNGQPVYVRLYSYIDGAWEYTSYTYTATGSATPAALTAPTPGSKLTGTSVAFAWTPGNVATQFQLWVGTTSGSSNLYNSNAVTATTETVSDLPDNDSEVYVRLYSYIAGAWQYTSYTYTSAGTVTQAALTTPTPGSTLTGTSVTFAWTPGNTAKNFQLYLGSTGVGTNNLYNSGSVTVTSETVSDLPSNGEKVYARLFSYINGAWVYTDYTYTTMGAPTQAALTTPTPGTTLTGTSITFSWTPGNTATHFQLYLGTSAGSNNLYNSGSVTVTSETVSDLPSNGLPVYARLFSYVNGAWIYTDYTYTTAGAATPAALTTPTPGSQLTSSSVTFSWTPGNTAKNFELWLGSTNGASNLYNSGSVTVTSKTVTGLPNNGEKIYARLYWYINGAWQYASYTYSAF